MIERQPLIVTVTLNPAVDVTYAVPRLEPGRTHLVTAITEKAGGKGINVARVLHQLGHPVRATGILAGATGAWIRSQLDGAGIAHDFVDLPHAATRRTLAVVDQPDDVPDAATAGTGANADDRSRSRATLLSEPGPTLTELGWRSAETALATTASDADVVVLSGRLPAGLPPTAYADLATRIGPERCLVDATGPALRAAARAGVAVLKPNADELREATGESDPAAGARALIGDGAGTVVVTLGRPGIMAVTSNNAWVARQPAWLTGNPTGAGDAAAAAIAAGLSAGLEWPEILKDAVAWSAAAVPVAYAGEVDVPTLDRLRRTLETVDVEELR